MAVDSKTGDLSVATAALSGSGPFNFTLAGDSVGQGTSQIAYGDSFAALVESAIRTRFPGKTINLLNLSVPGVSWGELTSDAYVPPSMSAGYMLSPPVPSLWPNGVNSGQSWILQVKNTAPHLLAFEVGINASADVVSTVALIRQMLQTRLPTWTPKPSIVLLTPAIPSTHLGGAWPQIAQDAQGGADAIRALAAEFNATIVDVNALYRLLLEGIDVTRAKSPVVGPTDFASWTTLAGVRPTLSAGVLNFSGGWGIVHSPETAVNIDMAARMAVNAGGVGALWYRFTGPGTGYLVHMQTYVPQVVLYYGGSTVITSASVASASDYRVHVEAIGARHKVWVNGALVINVMDHKQWRPGTFGVEATGGTISEFSVGAGYPVIATPKYTEAEMLGGGTLPTGNGINHPTELGHREAYFAAFAPLFDHLQIAA